MHNNNDMVFNPPAKKGRDENDVKISIIELRKSEENSPYADLERIQTAIKSLNAGTWTLDISTNSLIVCNRCNEIIPICALKNVNIKSLCDLVIDGYKKRFSDALLLALYKGLSFDLEVPVVVFNNSRPKWLRITGTTTFNSQNSRAAIHGTVEDISERKGRELLKQDFLAIASHDLRSPLSVIKLYLQLCSKMAGDTGNNKICELLHEAGLQVHKMNKMIQCYLESSTMATGNISLSRTAFEMKELLEEVIGDMHLLYGGHIIFLKPGRSIEICADRDKIAQVLQNLLNNAIKYSSPLDVITVQFDTPGNFLQVVVEDHGIGIDAADQERIFDRFYRVNGENGNGVTGYGIGLYLSKEIIKKHNGDIWIESEVGKGSKFYFTLPLS